MVIDVYWVIMHLFISYFVLAATARLRFVYEQKVISVVDYADYFCYLFDVVCFIEKRISCASSLSVHDFFLLDYYCFSHPQPERRSNWSYFLSTISFDFVSRLSNSYSFVVLIS